MKNTGNYNTDENQNQITQARTQGTRRNRRKHTQKMQVFKNFSCNSRGTAKQIDNKRLNYFLLTQGRKTGPNKLQKLLTTGHGKTQKKNRDSQ